METIIAQVSDNDDAIDLDIMIDDGVELINDDTYIDAILTANNEITINSYNNLSIEQEIPDLIIGQESEKIQSDWNETNIESPAYIKNKPNIPPKITIDNHLSNTSINPVQNKIVTENNTWFAVSANGSLIIGKGLPV